MINKFYKILIFSVFLNILCVFGNNVRKKNNLNTSNVVNNLNFHHSVLFSNKKYQTYQQTSNKLLNKTSILKELSLIKIKNNKNIQYNFLNKNINNLLFNNHFLEIQPNNNGVKFDTNNQWKSLLQGNVFTRIFTKNTNCFYKIANIFNRKITYENFLLNESIIDYMKTSLFNNENF